MSARHTLSALFIVPVLLLDGCGRSPDTSGAASTPSAGTPDAIVTLDGERHACLVALRGEPHGSTIPCGDLVSFLKDELRLPSGSLCDIRSIGDVDRAETARVEANLDAAGFRLYSKIAR